MGVLNITPDSFSDGGKFFGLKRAVDGALAMERAGADLLDIGAESTRPGLGHFRRGRIAAAVAGARSAAHTFENSHFGGYTKGGRRGNRLGSGRRALERYLRAEKRSPCGGNCGKIRRAANPDAHAWHAAQDAEQPFAKDVLKDVIAGLRHSIAIARRAGVRNSQIILDPGIGFGKSFQQNYELLVRLPELAKLGYPLLVGTSRKGFLGATLASRGKPAPPEARIWGTAATVTASILGGAHIVRVHDVAEMAEVAKVADALRNASSLRTRQL